MEFFKIVLTALLSVAALFAATKIMGHKQVAQLDFFDYINGITVGSIAAELATEPEEPYKPLLALIIYGAVSIFLSIMTRKLPKTRKFINGTPTILMNDGILLRKNLKKAKLDLSEFMLLCREAGYFDLSEIQCAIFEYNGRLSVLPKSAFRPLTPSDMKIPVKAPHLQAELIIDGKILTENLHRLKRDEKWLKDEMHARGYKSEKDIFLCLYSEGDDDFLIYPIKM